ncbi:hypothetical protein [Roseovarius sp. E0-M6]|uniref:hypothetical protein n=1 Tax=Roseovarius sp. E0-M6 TaxID=3127118 RepID=UPI00300FC9AB
MTHYGATPGLACGPAANESISRKHDRNSVKLFFTASELIDRKYFSGSKGDFAAPGGPLINYTVGTEA